VIYDRRVHDRRRVYYDHEPAYQKIRDKGGRGWDDLFEGEQGSYISIRAFLEGERPVPGARALELGCGGGQVAIELARAGFRATGIDYAETAIELARANAREVGVDVTFAVGDALALAFADASFDLVVDNHALHCIVEPADRARVLAECYRVLVPGGRLWSETMWFDGCDWASVDADPVTGIARNCTRIWIRRDVLEQELRAVGFEIASTTTRDAGATSDLVTLARKPAVAMM
jgi:SAM-dependent methyltransferase